MKLIAVQQSVMTALGFYDGDIDGVWGPKCVAAMNRWQLEDSFDPALPNNGYFFTPPSRLPKGLSWAAGRSGELQYFGMSADIRAKIDKLMAEQYKPITIQRVNEEVLGTAKQEVTTNGDTFLGGEDFDNTLLKHLVAEFKKEVCSF